MTIRIGINPLTWSNDDMPELGAHISLQQCLSEGKQAGYAGFELGHKFPRDSATLGAILDHHQLALVSGWYSLRLLERSVAQEIEAVQPHLGLLRDLDCQVMVCCEVTGCIHGDRAAKLSARPRLSTGEYNQFAPKLTAFADYLQSEGVSLAFHHHMGTVIQSADDIRTLMDLTSDAVGLLLDTGHMTYAGDDPVAVAKAFSARIVHLHCKDIRPDVLRQVQAQDSSFLDAVLAGVFTVPGDGGVDFGAILRALPGNYSGWVVVEAEQDPARAEPLRYAQMGYQYLSSLLAGRLQYTEDACS